MTNPVPTPAEALKAAWDWLVWWAEHEALPDNQRFFEDLAETQEDAERRLFFLQTMRDPQRRVEWFRAALASQPAADLDVERRTAIELDMIGRIRNRITGLGPADVERILLEEMIVRDPDYRAAYRDAKGTADV